MSYFYILGLTFSFFLGALSLFLIFKKRFLSELMASQNSKKIDDLLEANIDLSLCKEFSKATELDRERIRTEMHDELAYLSSLNYDLEYICEKFAPLPRGVEQKADEMTEKIGAIIEAIRRILFGLMPEWVDKSESLNFALKKLCHKYEDVRDTKILFRVTGEAIKLNDLQNLSVFRITQELLINAIRHAQAWYITVHLIWEKEELRLIVKDNGRGMIKLEKEVDRFGITGIFVRAKEIGATVQFKQPKKGTEVELVLPLENVPVLHA